MFGLKTEGTGQILAPADSKKYGLIDHIGVLVYSISGGYIETVDGSPIVAVFDGENELKAVIHLMPGQAVMEVVDGN